MRRVAKRLLGSQSTVKLLVAQSAHAAGSDAGRGRTASSFPFKF
ncbi:hypothetical protein ACGUFB_06005 [Actinotignum schaalii]